MTNICELLINIVIFNKLKVLISLGQKARSGLPFCFMGAHGQFPLPVDRQGLIHSC